MFCNTQNNIKTGLIFGCYFQHAKDKTWGKFWNISAVLSFAFSWPFINYRIGQYTIEIEVCGAHHEINFLWDWENLSLKIYTAINLILFGQESKETRNSSLYFLINPKYSSQFCYFFSYFERISFYNEWLYILQTFSLDQRKYAHNRAIHHSDG